MDAAVEPVKGEAALRAAIPLTSFAREHGVQLTRFAFLISGDRGRGEDLVQDALFGMYRRFGAELRLADPMAYAHRAIVNAHLSWLRHRPGLESLVDRLPERPAPIPDGSDAADAVWVAMAGLPNRPRTVLVLRYYVGMSDREIGRVLSCRESSVRSLAARAFAFLRPVLAPTKSRVEAD